MANQHVYKILVVDDEPDTRECIRNYLEKRCRAEVLDAGDGLAAVEMAQLMKPDLVILDIHMPKLDGWGVIQEIRKFNSSAKIIVITGWETVSEDQQRLLNEHVAIFMRKPLVLDDVLQAISTVLGTDFQQADIPTIDQSCSKGRPEARAIVHALVNIHSRIRMKCDYFVSNYEDGYFKEKPEVELLKESVKILKDIASAVDDAGRTVEEIRKL